MKVFVMGVGMVGTFPASAGLSYRELIARAATMAYQDAGITANQLDGAISVEEDLISGYSIADEYVPDQLGVVKKAVYTVCGDFLHGIASGVMQIKSGQQSLLVVEGYSKASNILEKDEVLSFGYDPIMNRLGVSPHYLAGIEMQNFLKNSSYTQEDVAELAVAIRKNAVRNPQAAYGAIQNSRHVLNSRKISDPVTEAMISRPADGAVVVVLGTEEQAKHTDQPVVISGTGWASGSSIIERRDHSCSQGTKIAAARAFEEAGISDINKDCDAYFLSDLYAHRALMHADNLGITRDKLYEVNPDGGSLGMGDLIEANGGARLYNAVQMLRGNNSAGNKNQSVSKALVHGWRGLPTDSCAVTILES